MTLHDLKVEFSEVTKIKIFEIEVFNTRTKEPDYVTFEIFIEGNEFIAQHEALSLAQENSKTIAFVSRPLDEDFSLDENLQELHENCIEVIQNNEFFNLIN